jgi:epoxyqueuosine reductase
MFNEDSKSLQRQVIKTIEDFITSFGENTLDEQTREKAFDLPLVGFSRGDEPLFADFKKHVGPFHWTPGEIFSLSFPEENVAADHLSIISWVLPQAKATKKDNRREKSYPSHRWVRARIFGEAVNEKLRAHLVSFLSDKGFKAVAPVISPH